MKIRNFECNTSTKHKFTWWQKLLSVTIYVFYKVHKFKIQCDDCVSNDGPEFGSNFYNTSDWIPHYQPSEVDLKYQPICEDQNGIFIAILIQTNKLL